MPDDRPNVLWVCTDQQRFDTLGCYGNEHVDTPNLDRLAERGTRFERAYCQSPVCTPSRASFMTGRYPRVTGARWNGHPIDDDETLVPRLFAEAGYHTALAGKLHVRPENPDDGAPTSREPYRRGADGYGDFRWSPKAYDPTPENEYRQWLRDRDVEFEVTPYEGSEHVSTSVPAEHHQAAWCAEGAVDVIEGDADPWFVSVHPFAPHTPFDPPEAYLERYLDDLEAVPLPAYVPGELDDEPAVQRRRAGDDIWGRDAMDADEHRLVRAAYWAMVDLVDDQVGRMLDALDRTGQREDTVVVFQSDHGELLGDHGMYRKGQMFYEPSVRVPLVVDGPGVASRETDALVELLDVAPTLLEAAGLDRPPGMQGESLWPLLRGDTDAGRDAVYCEAIADHPAEEGRTATMLRTDDRKVVRHHGTGEGELYDLRDDPGEHENLWADPDRAGERADLTLRLADRLAETVDPLPESEGPW